jgi:O-antigen/teichoic acid export membrane protein
VARNYPDHVSASEPPDDGAVTGTSRATVARTMLTSIVRAALPPLVAVVTLPIILGRVSLNDYGLWATITGLIAVLATIDGGLATDITRRVAAARGAEDAEQVTDIGRHGISVAVRLAVVVMPLTALAGIPIIHWVAPPQDFALGIGLWLGVVVYQTIGWYYALLAAVVTGLQRGDLANSVNAVGALVSAVVTVVAVVAGMGVWGLLVGMFALGIVTTAGQMYASRKLTGTARVWLPEHGPHARAILLAGLALATLQGSLMIEPAMAKAIVSALDGPESAAAMQLGFTVTRLALVAAMAPTATILVGVSEWRDTQPERIAGLVRNAAHASLALALVLATVMLASGPYMAQAWLGIDVPGIGVAIRGLSGVAVVTITVWLFTQTLLGHGNTKPVTLRLLAGTVVSLAGMAALAPVAGIPGVIGASLVGGLVAAVLLGRIDGEYEAIIWRAFARLAPAMLALGVVGAVVIDWLNPQGRVAALLVAAAAGVVAVVAVWLLLPGATRGLIRRALGERLGRS